MADIQVSVINAGAGLAEDQVTSGGVEHVQSDSEWSGGANLRKKAGGMCARLAKARTRCGLTFVGFRERQRHKCLQRTDPTVISLWCSQL